MRKIPLRARDGSVRAYALVDDQDYEHLSQWSWALGPQGYPVRTVSMHAEVGIRMGLRDVRLDSKLLLHHGNENKLDNRRRNLALKTRARHNRDHNLRPGNRIRRTRGGRWYAWRNANGRQIGIGTFDTEEEARGASPPS